MNEKEESGTTLGFEFSKAQELYQKIENSSLSSSDPSYQGDVKQAIQHLLRASSLIQKLSIFSKNEILEDISTSDLKFLLVDFYLSEFYSKVSGGDRMKIVMSSMNFLNTFLLTCQNHEIFNEFQKESYEKIENPRPKTIEQQREEKISRHKRTKELNLKLNQLEEARKKNAEKHEGEDNDEEVDRDHTLTLIHLCIEKSFDNLSVLAQEIQILQHMEQLKLQNESQGSKQPSEPDTKEVKKPFKPIVIKNTREVLQQQVFRPGWTQPTMTIDQYLELEMQRGNVLTGGGPEQEERMAREKEEKLLRDSEQEADEETYKLRKDDEWKDYTRRGDGNRYNRS